MVADGKTDSFATDKVRDDAAVLSAANQDPAFDAAVAAHDRSDRAAAEHRAQDVTSQDLGHGGLDGQRDLATARPEGSVAETGTRTEDPVGTNQAESSAIHKPPAGDGASKTDKA